MPGSDIRENVSLQPLTTLQVPVRARWFRELDDPAILPDMFAFETGTRPVLVLGEGSNCLFTGDYDGLVLHMALRGKEILAGDDESALVRAAAGENWHAFVHWTLAQGLSGLENLALIPGTVGAAPIQNIGAYGVEVERRIDTVEAWDSETAQTLRLTRDDCAFAYRDSLFKRYAGRYVVLAVEFRLPRRFSPVLDYAGLRERLARWDIGQPTAADVAAAVESLRREKLPDPAQIGNAGSFFKNPVVTAAEAMALREKYPELPAYPSGDGMKLSAGWLIEHAGMKGYREGDAGISSRHALVLVNHGNATGEQLWAVAVRVRETVMTHFGIDLEPEPRVF